MTVSAGRRRRSKHGGRRAGAEPPLRTASITRPLERIPDPVVCRQLQVIPDRCRALVIASHAPITAACPTESTGWQTRLRSVPATNSSSSSRVALPSALSFAPRARAAAARVRPAGALPDPTASAGIANLGGNDAGERSGTGDMGGNAEWTALTDSVKRDLADLPGSRARSCPRG